MRRVVWTCGGLVVALLSSGLPAQAAGPAFDGRGWTVGNHQASHSQSLTEYVLPGQTVDSWKELVTSTVFLQPVPVGALVERIHGEMQQGCPSLVWKVISQDEMSAVFEWRDSGCGGFPPQRELDRLSLQKDGVYRLAYASQGSGELAAGVRKQWLGILGQVPLAEGTASASMPAAGGKVNAAAPASKTMTTADLVTAVKKAGWPCTAGVKSEVKGQTGGAMTQYVLTCTGGTRYMALVDPSGGVTAFQVPK